MVRNSISHPLRIDELRLGNGTLGITFCPGKKGRSEFGSDWDRDLGVDLDAIKFWGADAVVTLIEDYEFKMLCVPELGQMVKARGIDWFHFPIRDLDVPSCAEMEKWPDLSSQLHSITERGGRVIVHCRGGLGRAGTIAALLLIERGRAPHQAINDVRCARSGAIETVAQEEWLGDHDRFSDQTSRQLHASLLGGAIGDSLGADVEFLSLSAIRDRFPHGILDIPPFMGQKGAITDDTQMTLFTAEGLIRAYIRGTLRGICHPPSVVHHALLRWLRTQGGSPRMSTDDVGLVADNRLWARRAPRLTCLSSLSESQRFGDSAKNGSKGCGTIMRVAPIALMAPRNQVRSIAIETSALTHGHPTGQLAAASWAEILADVARGVDLEHATRNIVEEYDSIEYGGETVRAIQNALEAPRDGSPETVETLGGGWTAEEALSIALYASLSASSFDHALQIAVIHSGDSNSTGAITGNMMGLIEPQAALEHRWASLIEGADIISRLAYDYQRVKREEDGPEKLSLRYPGF